MFGLLRKNFLQRVISLKFLKRCSFIFFVMILASLGILALLYPLTILVWGLGIHLNPNLYQIENSFYESIENGDKDAMFTYAGAYERTEKKYWRKKSDSKEPFAYKCLYMIAYEFCEDYDNALIYDKTFLDKDVGNSYLCVKRLRLPHTKARILYKKGMKKDAFIEYCLSAPCDNEYWGVEGFKYAQGGNEYRLNLYKEKKRQNITLQSIDDNLLWQTKLSCFSNYDEFLKFLDEEYKKLGSPEEYAEAVMKYHSFALVEEGDDK